MNDESRNRINAGAGRLHELSRQILGVDWYATESQARRVIEHFAEAESQVDASVEVAPVQDEQCDTCHGQGEIWTGETAYQGHFQPPEPVMDTCPECSGESVTGRAQTVPQPEQPVKYTIGDLTYEKVFKAAGLTNLSDMQAVLDAVEVAVAQTEQQPVAWRWMYNGEPDGPYAFNYPLPDDDVVRRGLMAERPRTVQPLYAAPIVQTEPAPAQGDVQ